MPKRTVAFGGKVLRFDPRLPVDCQPLRARILGAPGRATPFAAPARENPAPADGRRIRRHYQPVGWLEESRVEEIAVLSWRLRRLLRWESGMTARALATNSYNLQESKTSSLEEPEAVPSSSPEMDAITDHLFLPSNEELDKLVRYEALLNRQLNHAIAELERLQTRRKEGSTPP